MERITALAHARQAETFNPSAVEHPAEDKQKKLKRRVSLGAAINAETGEVLESGVEGLDAGGEILSRVAGRRHSTRTHTVANTSAADIRARDEVRKVSSSYGRCSSRVSVVACLAIIHPEAREDPDEGPNPI